MAAGSSEWPRHVLLLANVADVVEGAHQAGVPLIQTELSLRGTLVQMAV